MRPEDVMSQLVRESWQPPVAHAPVARARDDRRSTHAMGMIELAHILATAETAVLLGDDTKAVANLKRLHAETLALLATFDTPATDAAA